MSDNSESIFPYDKTLDGLLTCIFDAYQLKIFPTHLIAEGEPLPLFTNIAHTVVTDEQKSVRVWTALEKKLSKSALHSITVSWLADSIEGVDEFCCIRATLQRSSSRNQPFFRPLFRSALDNLRPPSSIWLYV